MTRKLDTTFIQIVHPVCCGLDVHKKKISACLITIDELGEEQYEIKEFGTFTHNLLIMKKWLMNNRCPILAMESTGVYWRPVHNILEGYLEIILVNARHIKNVPGRKTDIGDSKWLAGLLRHGLLRGSFIPPKEIRQWRELTRLRRTYTESLADYKRRVHKLFETANIKIDSKEKSKELHHSIQGFFEDHHRFQLVGMMEMITTFEKHISKITDRMDTLTAGHQDLLNRLDEIPGIDKKSAQSIVSEIGVTLDEFICMGALASWAGLCPGNNESAGKRKTGRTSVRSHPFKTILIEVAWAAVKKKDSYYRANQLGYELVPCMN
ncbi:IS110 family transposase [Desulfobacula sp.]|uniref:IS110 family transposase n=1 Tax=Desulfobacula sp. TaxID=2593537 RepID=UPI00260F9779|nr:IS110 family transposase [Desulfobacula sp.]